MEKFREKNYYRNSDNYERLKAAAMKQDREAEQARQRKWDAIVERNRYKAPKRKEDAQPEEKAPRKAQIAPKQIEPKQPGPNELVFTGNTQWGKAMQYYDGNCKPRCMIYEQDLQAQFTLGVRTLQGQYTAMITKYRSLVLPGAVAPSMESADFSFTLSQLNGTRVKQEVAAPLLVNYDESGKLIQLTIPGTVNIPGFNDSLPLVTMYRGVPYTVPITAGTFKFLAQKVRENNGIVDMGHVDQGGIVEYVVNILPLHVSGLPGVSTPLMGDGHKRSGNDKCCAVM